MIFIGQAEYNNLSVSELKDYLEEDEERRDKFLKKKQRGIELLLEGGDTVQLSTADFDNVEKVVHTEQTGDKRWRPYTMYEEKIFNKRFPKSMRKGLSFEKEDENGEVYYRVFDDEEGVFKGECYVDSSTAHKTRLDDTLRLSKNQAAETYESAIRSQFDQKRFAKAPTRADLGLPKVDQFAAAAAAQSSSGKVLAKQDSTASESSSSSSNSVEDAPLMKSFQKKELDNKSKAKGKAKSKQSPSSVSSTKAIEMNDDDEMEDKPASKTDLAFMRQTLNKLSESEDVLAHITKAQTLKQVDDARIVKSIRTMDGRMDKIVRAGLLKTRKKTVLILLQLRGITKMLKGVRAFENKKRQNSKQAEASTGLAIVFQGFPECKFPMDRLPWCIRIVLLLRLLFLLPLSVVVASTMFPFGVLFMKSLNHRKWQIYILFDFAAERHFEKMEASRDDFMEDNGLEDSQWDEVILLLGSDYMEVLICKLAAEHGWSVEVLTSNLHQTMVDIKGAVNVDDENMEYVRHVAVVTDIGSSTLSEVQTSNTWLASHRQINRGVMALMDWPQGEAVMLKVKDLLESAVKDRSAVNGFEKSRIAISETMTAMQAAVSEEVEAKGESNKLVPVKKNMHLVEQFFKDLGDQFSSCNAQWTRASSGLRADMAPAARQCVECVSAALDYMGKGAVDAMMDLHKEISTSLGENCSVGDDEDLTDEQHETICRTQQDLEKRLHWVYEVSNAMGFYARMSTVNLEVPCSMATQSVYITAKFLYDSMNAQVLQSKSELQKKARKRCISSHDSRVEQFASFR